MAGGWFAAVSCLIGQLCRTKDVAVGSDQAEDRTVAAVAASMSSRLSADWLLAASRNSVSTKNGGSVSDHSRFAPHRAGVRASGRGGGGRPHVERGGERRRAGAYDAAPRRP